MIIIENGHLVAMKCRSGLCLLWQFSTDGFSRKPLSSQKLCIPLMLSDGIATWYFQWNSHVELRKTKTWSHLWLSNMWRAFKIHVQICKCNACNVSGSISDIYLLNHGRMHKMQFFLLYYQQHHLGGCFILVWLIIG